MGRLFFYLCCDAFRISIVRAGLCPVPVGRKIPYIGPTRDSVCIKVPGFLIDAYGKYFNGPCQVQG